MPGIILNAVHTFSYLPLQAHDVSSVFPLCGWVNQGPNKLSQ